MITVCIQRGLYEKTRGFVISGHAEYDKGSAEYDIVCAAVSAVTLTAALGLKDVLGKEGRYETKDGFLSVDIGDNEDAQSEAVIQTMLRGLKEIQKQYPNRIQIQRAGGDQHVSV